MESGTSYMVLEVDKKGRMHLPKMLREKMHIESQVVAEVEGNKMVKLRAIKKIEDPISFLVSLKVKTKKTLIGMKREAEEVFER